MSLKITLIAIIVFFSGLFVKDAPSKEISLPEPCYKGKKSVEEAIKQRRTIRSFKSNPLTINNLSQILWAGDGITDKRRMFRSAPSAGALYPLDIFIVVGKDGTSGLGAGVYQYIPERHSLRLIKEGDVRETLAMAALYQMWIAEAPVVIVITGCYERCTIKYGNRGIPYTYIEAGHVGQNIFLQCEALGLSAGIVGAFYNQKVIECLGIKKKNDPILIMPVGYKK